MNHESVWSIEPVTHDEKPNNPTGCDGGEPERQWPAACPQGDVTR
ncbi:hypothetical protein ACK1C5_004376 [Salmonella enterica]